MSPYAWMIWATLNPLVPFTRALRTERFMLRDGDAGRDPGASLTAAAEVSGLEGAFGAQAAAILSSVAAGAASPRVKLPKTATVRPTQKVAERRCRRCRMLLGWSGVADKLCRLGVVV